jgi:hypothetical protein
MCALFRAQTLQLHASLSQAESRGLLDGSRALQATSVLLGQNLGSLSANIRTSVPLLPPAGTIPSAPSASGARYGAATAATGLSTVSHIARVSSYMHEGCTVEVVPGVALALDTLSAVNSKAALSALRDDAVTYMDKKRSSGVQWAAGDLNAVHYDAACSIESRSADSMPSSTVYDPNSFHSSVIEGRTFKDISTSGKLKSQNKRDTVEIELAQKRQNKIERRSNRAFDLLKLHKSKTNNKLAQRENHSSVPVSIAADHEVKTSRRRASFAALPDIPEPVRRRGRPITFRHVPSPSLNPIDYRIEPVDHLAGQKRKRDVVKKSDEEMLEELLDDEFFLKL